MIIFLLIVAVIGVPLTNQECRACLDNEQYVCRLPGETVASICCEDDGCVEGAICEIGNYGHYLCANGPSCGDDDIVIDNNSEVALVLDDIPVDEMCVFHTTLTSDRSEIVVDFDIETLYSGYDATFGVYV